MLWTLPPTEGCGWHTHPQPSRAMVWGLSWAELWLLQSPPCITGALLPACAVQWLLTLLEAVPAGSAFLGVLLGQSQRWHVISVDLVVQHHCKRIYRKRLWKSVGCEWKESSFYKYLLWMFQLFIAFRGLYNSTLHHQVLACVFEEYWANRFQAITVIEPHNINNTD